MLKALNRNMKTAILYISHDLQSVASICQRIAILHDGEIVESASTEHVLLHPRHPYTKRLLACAPWLPWWWKESQSSKRQKAGTAQPEELVAHGQTTPEQLYWRLKSPSRPPIS
jgi:ABC-type dipeptide/oligopeptide/nickel transport system ATPase component